MDENNWTPVWWPARPLSRSLAILEVTIIDEEAAKMAQQAVCEMERIERVMGKCAWDISTSERTGRLKSPRVT